MDPSEHLRRLMASMFTPPPASQAKKFDLHSVVHLLVGEWLRSCSYETKLTLLDERLFPLSTLYYFIDFSFEGRLPTGDKTTLELILEDEVPLMTRPYAHWATPPWNRVQFSMQQRLIDTPKRFCVDVPRRISVMRARLWEGITPMSDTHWKARKLDDTSNWQSVFEFVFEIIQTFEWLGNPDIQIAMKNSFNHIAVILDEFGSAINARRALKNIEAKINMRALWLEYITSLFTTMVTRTHSFILKKVKSTIAKARAEYDDVANIKGDANSLAEAKKCGEVWSDLERALHRADTYIMMSMDGYTGFTASTGSKVVGSLFPLPFRWDQRKELEQEQPWPITEQNVDEINTLRTNRRKMFTVFDESDRSHDHVRSLQRGEPISLSHEHWISIIHSRTNWSLSHGGPEDQKWGFVGYKLTHKTSQQEWELFLARLYADFERSGQGVEGFETVKPNMDIQWIDGESNGLPHDDIEAAKRHFATFSSSADIRKRVWKIDFLVVDSECFASYMSPQPKFGSIKCSGDYDGYLKLIDTATYKPELIAATSPGYSNQIRVLGRLIFDDIYPQQASQRPRDMWPLAMLHPKQVYVGFPVKGQMIEWETVWNIRTAFVTAFWRWRQL